jgi:uncharacterized protein (DUF1800 family)
MIPRSDLVALRFGDGLPLAQGAATDPGNLVNRLADPDRMLAAYPRPGMAQALAFLRDSNAVTQASKKDKSKAAQRAFEDAKKEVRSAHIRGAKLAIARALDAPDGFRERLVRFWADHFTVRSKNRFQAYFPGAFVDEAIRPHIAGRFPDLLRAATLHPAMLNFLDQSSSVGPNSRVGQRRDRGLNENLAREVIELHTLGVGGSYTQADVTQMAELLTGLTFTADEGFLFRPEMAEPGPETVLGRSYDGKGTDPILAVLDDIALRPDTARHIARKLAVHFVADDPDAGLGEALARASADPGGDLPAVYRAMFAQDAAWDGTLRKARQPVDFLIAALRGLGVTGAQVAAMEDNQVRRSLFNPLAAMGQPWQNPRGPDGWPEAEANWITPQLLAARVTWAMQEPDRLVKSLPDPADLVARVLGQGADGRVTWAAARAETVAEGVALVFASPGFNRR